MPRLTAGHARIHIPFRVACFASCSIIALSVHAAMAQTVLNATTAGRDSVHLPSEMQIIFASADDVVSTTIDQIASTLPNLVDPGLTVVPVLPVQFNGTGNTDAAAGAALRPLDGTAVALDQGDANAQVAQAATAGILAQDQINTEQVLITARMERHQEELMSVQTIKTLDQDQIKASSTIGGIAQALNLVPGVSEATYGQTGSTKTTISIDGIKLGWAGFSGGNPDNGSIGVSFDGVPMQNPGNGLWQTTLIPQGSLIQNMSVTYGPGDPRDRLFTNIGGGLNFVPVQPTGIAGGEVDLSYGSFNTKNIAFNVQFADADGWDTVIAGGADAADSFYTAPDGFTSPNQNWAIFAKTRKSLADGDFSLGFYASRSGAYRPLATPVTPIDPPSCSYQGGPTPGPCNVTINGFNQPGPQFSQATTGFYTTLPRSVDYKYDTNAIRMGYADLNLGIGDIATFHNLFYVDYENRLHWTPLHDYVLGGPTQFEINQPHSFVVGDKPSVDINLPYNTVTVGGILEYAQYHSREQLYNPNLPIAPRIPGSPVAPNGPYFSDIFDLTNWAVFLQDDITPIPTLHITPGVRYFQYYTDFTHDEAAEFPNGVLYNPGGQLSQFPATGKQFDRIEPSVGANWQALDFLALYGNWGISYREPENGGGTGPYVALAPANVHLEKGEFYNAGAKLHWDQIGPAQDISIDASYYNLDFTNETIPTALASGGALLAFGSSILKGVNIFADASPLPNLYVFTNLGIVSANFTNFINGSGTFHNIPVPNTPVANFNVGLYYQFFFGNGFVLEPRVSYQFTGKQHLYDNSQNITSALTLPSYGIVNMSAELDVPLNDVFGVFKMVTFTVEADNLLNREYNAFEYVSAGGLYGGNGYMVGTGAVLGLPAPPRTIVGTLGVKF